MRRARQRFNLLCVIGIAFFGMGTVWQWRHAIFDFRSLDKLGTSFAILDFYPVSSEQGTMNSELDYAVLGVEQDRNTSTRQQIDTATTTVQQSNTKSQIANLTLVSSSGREKSKIYETVIDRVSVDEILPVRLNLPVPFTSQAPEKNWDQPWQDACEEAAILMLDAYYKKYGLSPLFARDEILKMVAWEEERGWGRSIEIEKIKEIMEDYLDYKKFQDPNNKYQTNSKFQIPNSFTVIVNPTIDQIKHSIAAGHPVLAVADGKILPNPHFRNGGPVYHALIIRGYTEDSFITNDPGTQFGENYVYKYDDLMNAVRDWNDGDVKNGRRVVLMLAP